jgi:hypothetical protein
VPVLLLEKDPFLKALDGPSEALPFTEVNVRRPLEGVIRKNTRHAFLSVYSQSGGQFKATQLINSSAPTSGLEAGGVATATHNFITQSITHSQQEKVQIVETFGDSYAFFYGSKPSVLQVQGILINTPDFNWKNEWLQNYERYLRGTKCVETRSRVYLGFDDVLINGYILNTSIAYASDNPAITPFNFAMLITGYRDLSEGGADYALSADNTRTLLDGARPEYVRALGVVDAQTGELLYQDGGVDSLAGSVDTDLEMGQSGGDRTTVQIQQRSDSSSSLFGSRDGNSSSVSDVFKPGTRSVALVTA